MSRILKRPMFRKGGTPNEGIMFGLQEPRMAMQEGGVPDEVGLPKAISQNRPGIFRRIIQALNPSPETIVKRARDVQEAPYLFEGIFDPAVETLQFRTPEEETAFYEKFPKLKLPEIKTEPTKEPKPEPKVGPEKAPKSDTDTIKDYMDMFKTALAEDPDEIRRQKYLQLAQFGANLLAQPGGDLAAAIGKAAEPSLAGLAKIQERKQDVATKAKLLGVEAAMKKGQLAQNIQDLVDLGYSREEAIKKIVEEGSGSATRQATEQKAREQLTSYISETHGMPSATASRISGKVFASGIPDYLYDLIPSNPTQEDVGKYFYDKVGNVGKLVVKNGKFGLDDGKK
jgi:hypothetical protein